MNSISQVIGVVVFLASSTAWSQSQIYESKKSGKSPAVILIAGCSGDFLLKGESYYQTRAASLADAGYNVTILDPVRKRGYKSCTGNLLATDAKGDVFGAIEAIKAHPKVDPERIFLIGFSFGGAVAMEALTAATEEAPVIRGVALMYPSCGRNHPWKAKIPTLAFLASEDNVTPVRDCETLFSKMEGFPIRKEVMANVHHGFDDHRLPERHWLPGSGTVGYRPAAAQQSWAVIQDFLKN